ncbi:MAG: hypothetical protein GY832_17065 [Chloroflexi bacterium]|nr:hypothetical protein [Chloroflexota bacterium]
MNNKVIGSTFDNLLPNTSWGWLWWIISIVFAFQCYYTHIYPKLSEGHLWEEWATVETAHNKCDGEKDNCWGIGLKYPLNTAQFLPGEGEIFVTNHYAHSKSLTLALALVDADPPHNTIVGVLPTIEQGQGNAWLVEDVPPGATVASEFVWDMSLVSPTILSELKGGVGFAIHNHNDLGTYCITKGIGDSNLSGQDTPSSDEYFETMPTVKLNAEKTLIYATFKLLLIPPGANIVIPVLLLLFVALAEKIASFPNSYTKLVQILVAVAMANVLMLAGASKLVSTSTSENPWLRFWPSFLFVIMLILAAVALAHCRNVVKLFRCRIVKTKSTPVIKLSIIVLGFCFSARAIWILCNLSMAVEGESVEKLIELLTWRACGSAILWGLGMACLFPVKVESDEPDPRPAILLINDSSSAYQLGQTVHIRALVANTITQLPIKSQKIKFILFDPQTGKKVAEGQDITSDVGIATWECNIPQAGSGPYQISAELEDDILTLTDKIEIKIQP